jgi:hypothetical protein
MTLDTLLLGWRPHDLDTAYPPFALLLGVGIYVGTSNPVYAVTAVTTTPRQTPRVPTRPGRAPHTSLWATSRRVRVSCSGQGDRARPTEVDPPVGGPRTLTRELRRSDHGQRHSDCRRPSRRNAGPHGRYSRVNPRYVRATDRLGVVRPQLGTRADAVNFFFF